MRLLAQRVGVLAGVALIAMLGTLALMHRSNSSPSSATQTVKAVPAPGTSWNEVRAGILSLTEKGKKTACGVSIGVTTFGVAHPSLPCGTRIFIAYGDIRVLTQVIARGPYVPGRELDLTPALAVKLNISGATDVRWRFAR
ncbi:MAG TPA: septal ring lytic transglycosylase RlpA family protein [Gaiellaceae bacterium]